MFVRHDSPCYATGVTLCGEQTKGVIMHARAIILLLLCASSVTAGELPTETDLRAAYCIPILQYSIDFLKSLSTTDLPSSVSPEEITAGLAENTSGLRRLQLYLVPRISHLELLGLTTAMQTAKEDLKKAEQYVESCTTKCNQSANKDKRASAEVRASAQGACWNKCTAENPLRSRLKECHDLRWLPY